MFTKFKCVFPEFGCKTMQTFIQKRIFVKKVPLH
jgi:hypothetical protein